MPTTSARPARRAGPVGTALALALLVTASQTGIDGPSTPSAAAGPAAERAQDQADPPGSAAAPRSPRSGDAPTEQPPPESGNGAPADDEAAAGASDDRSGGPTQSAGGASPPLLADEVVLHEPDLVVRAEERMPVLDAGDVEGADHATAVGELTATTTGPDDDERQLELLAVEPTGFRPLTPEVTAQSPGVWQRLAEGDVLVRHDVAHELQLELGGQLALRGEDGVVEVRIGALAANGAPPFAEVVVPGHVGAALGQPSPNALIVSADDGQEPEALAAGLEEHGEVEIRRPPEPERAAPRPTGERVEIEPFTYTSRGDGTIAIHGDWVQRNIVTVDLPRLGTTRCHRAMAPQLYAALQDIIDAGLYDHFKPDQFGGCWVPRHILWDPGRGLSMHAWGLAIDFNTRDNWYGQAPSMDPRIVEIFERWGFEWGGRWSTPDGMHFEVDRIVQVE